MNIIIKKETSAEYSEIDDFLFSVFQRDNESQMVKQIRNKNTYINELALIALLEERIVGYVLLSKVNIIGAENTLFTSLAIAPVAVSADHIGVKDKIIHYALDEARKSGYNSVLVSGDPIYYSELGFFMAEDADILAPFHSAEDELMALELVENGLDPVSGTVNFPEEFYLI